MSFLIDAVVPNFARSSRTRPIKINAVIIEAESKYKGAAFSAVPITEGKTRLKVLKRKDTRVEIETSVSMPALKCFAWDRAVRWNLRPHQNTETAPSRKSVIPFPGKGLNPI